MASLSRKARLQRCSWQLLEDLAFCCQRHQRRAELAAQVLVEKQGAMAPPSVGSGAGGSDALLRSGPPAGGALPTLPFCNWHPHSLGAPSGMALPQEIPLQITTN